jgi:hypothetical protein
MSEKGKQIQKKTCNIKRKVTESESPAQHSWQHHSEQATHTQMSTSAPREVKSLRQGTAGPLWGCKRQWLLQELEQDPQGLARPKLPNRGHTMTPLVCTQTNSTCRVILGHMLKKLNTHMVILVC